MVFDWRDTVAINVEKFATHAAKTQAYGIRVHDDLKAVVIFSQRGVGSTAVVGYGNRRRPSHHQSKIQIRPHPRHSLHQRDPESIKWRRRSKRSSQSTSTGRKGRDGQPGVGAPTPADSTTAESLLGQFRHGERICNNRQRGRRPEQRQEQRPPQDGQKDNAQIVAIPVHLLFPHSTTFEGTKQEQTSIKEQRREAR